VTTFLDDEGEVTVFPRAVDKTRLVLVFAFTLDVGYAVRDFAVNLGKRGRAVGRVVYVGFGDEEVSLVNVLCVDLLVEEDKAL